MAARLHFRVRWHDVPLADDRPLVDFDYSTFAPFLRDLLPIEGALLSQA